MLKTAKKYLEAAGENDPAHLSAAKKTKAKLNMYAKLSGRHQLQVFEPQKPLMMPVDAPDLLNQTALYLPFNFPQAASAAIFSALAITSSIPPTM